MLKKILPIKVLLISIILPGAVSMSDIKTSHPETHYPQKMVLVVPIADLRSKPEAVDPSVKIPTLSKTNPGQESQILFGEHLIALEESGDWVRVQALEQQKYRANDNTWVGYPGWIKKSQALSVQEFPKYNLVVNKPWAELSCELSGNTGNLMLSMGTKLSGTKQVGDYWHVLSADGKSAKILRSDVYHMTSHVTEDIPALRQHIVDFAKTLEGKFYSWGGRSAQDLKNYKISSFDCSGGTNLCLRALGLQIPRDAHEQYLRSSQTIASGADLKPGDFVFLSSKERKGRMSHVMIYLGDDTLLDTTNNSTCDHTRIISIEERLGSPREKLTHEQAFTALGFEGFVYFGTYLNSKEQVQALRDNELRSVYES